MFAIDPLFPPHAILVDRSFELLYVGATASRYLQHHGGRPTKRLLKLVHPELRKQVAEGLQAAGENSEPYESSKLTISVNGQELVVNLRIRQIHPPQTKNKFLLVSFEELGQSIPASHEFQFIGKEFSADLYIQQIQEELFFAKSSLQIKTEQFEAIIEELYAANEELRSITNQMEISEQNLRLVNQQLAERIDDITLLNSDLKNLISATSVAIIFLNSRLAIKRFTPRAAELFNLLETDLGRPITDFARWFGGKNLTDQIRQVARSNSSLEYETSDQHGNIYLARLQPYKTGDEQSDGVIINFIDITLRKKAEESLRQSEERLQMSQKLESIGRLAGGVAHDFNNMLTAILGYSDIGLQSLEASHPVYKYFAHIKKAGEQSAALTKQLLAFSRRQIMRRENISLNKIVVEAESLLERLIGEDIILSVELSSQDIFVQVDPIQITQVIINLAVNARDAMPQGGKLEIKTSCCLLEENSYPEFSVTQSGVYAKLSVSDNGTGIAEESRQNIFEPFYTTKKIGEGTGLGLATVYGIIKQLNGYIAVESQVGHGTTFNIYLPVVPEDLEDAC